MPPGRALRGQIVYGAHIQGAVDDGAAENGLGRLSAVASSRISWKMGIPPK